MELFDDIFGLAGKREYRVPLASLGRPKWLVDQYWGLWPLLEWVGVLSSALFLVSLTHNGLHSTNLDYTEAHYQIQISMC